MPILDYAEDIEINSCRLSESSSLQSYDRIKPASLFVLVMSVTETIILDAQPLSVPVCVLNVSGLT